MSQAQPSVPNPAETYEQGLVVNVFGPLANAVLQLVPPGPDDRVPDLACGTGIVLRRATRFLHATGQLSGIDMTPVMIRVALAICSAEAIHADVREALTNALPFLDRSFTVEYCQHGSQFFPDRQAALREILRMLERDGRLVVATRKADRAHDDREHSFELGTVS